MVPESMNKGPRPLMSMRVKFSKTGSLKFISHLDLNRTMQEAFLRAKLPIWYTEGFNPHPRIVFSPPLSVGVSSLTEFADFKLISEVSETEILSRLNSSFPKGLHAYSCYVPSSSFSDIKWGLYEIKYEFSHDVSADMINRINGLFEAGNIVIEKRTKSGAMKSVDISDGIKPVSVKLENGILTLLIKLSCDGLSFVNPRYISETLISAFPDDFLDAEESACRTEVYLADGETLFK